uniref:Uncharacterized protein n=1 Tax=Globisporangium ultimum (strain ATCC 200006 / CBS 805.95 / DAOM BR144) TaxID=431595 RepID=K3WPE4_GLOUD
MAMEMETAGTAPSTYDSSIHDNHHLASPVTEDERVDLSEDDAEEELDVLREYVRSSDGIIAQSIQRYVGFVRKRKRVVDPTRWTLIKSEHGLDVYKEHAEQRLMKTFVPSVGSGDEADARQAAKDEDVRRAVRTRPRGRSIGYDMRCESSYIEYPSTMVSAFCIGKVRGSLDTVMAGLYTDNTDDMHANCTIQFGDNVVLDCGVLQAFETESETAPYNFFGVKWLEKQGHVPGVVNQLCWVERTGIHTISSGRRFGYQLLKSMQLSDPDECASRASSVAIAHPVNVSLCYLYCQIDEDVVEVFVRGIVEIIMDDSSDAGEADAVRTAGDYILAIAKGRECGRMRKIAELIGQSKTARDQLTCQQAMLQPKLVNVHELARKKHGSSENSAKPPQELPLLQSRYGTLRRDAELPETLTSYREYQSFRMFLPIRDPRPSSSYRKNQKKRGNVLMQMLRKNQHRSTYLPEFLRPKGENEGEEQGATTGAH